jgi:hypothetical protein
VYSSAGWRKAQKAGSDAGRATMKLFAAATGRAESVNIPYPIQVSKTMRLWSACRTVIASRTTASVICCKISEGMVFQVARG